MEKRRRRRRIVLEWKGEERGGGIGMDKEGYLNERKEEEEK